MFNFHFLICFCIFVDKLLKNEINNYNDIVWRRLSGHLQKQTGKPKPDLE